MDDVGLSGGWFSERTSEASRVTPLPDDILGLRDLYGTWASTETDVVTYNVQHVAENDPPPLDGTYGDGLSNSQALSFGNGDLSSGTLTYYPRNVSGTRSGRRDAAAPGDTVRVKVCFGNHGPVGVSAVPIEIYLSSNETISTGDHLLTTGTLNIGGLTTICGTLDGVVSSSVPVGSYFIGVWLNDGSGSSNNVNLHNRKLSVVAAGTAP
jgi:hypothetical protein